LTKPFELKELKARVKVLFKRREKKIENIIKI
jgi:DNA-binding response OmpR family regulator